MRADEATTNHEENNYGLFSLSADAGTASGSNLLLYAMTGIAILGMYLQYKSWRASKTTKRLVRGGKEKSSFLQQMCDQGESSTPTDHHNARPSTGSDRGKATTMPSHNPQSCRNPGGPIGSPASYKATSYAVAKPNNAGKHAATNGRPGRNV